MDVITTLLQMAGEEESVIRKTAISKRSRETARVSRETDIQMPCV